MEEKAGEADVVAAAISGGAVLEARIVKTPGGKPLGVTLEPSLDGEGVCVVEVKPGGLVEDWNMLASERSQRGIGEGDVVVAVNGARGS